MHQFTKTLSLIMQKMVADLKNPKLFMKMIEDREHVDFKKIKPRLKVTMYPKKEQT